MKNIKYLFIGIITVLLLPTCVKAATLSFEGSPNNNTVTYNIEYTPDETPLDTIKLKIEKTNDNLIYNLTSDYGTCDSNSLECTLVTTTITTETTLAKVTIDNTTTEAQPAEIKISGDLPGATKTFTLKPTETTTTTTKPVIPNNNLSNLSVSVGMMDQTFNKDLSEYNITGIRDTVPTAKITPTCETECEWNITCPLGECSVQNPTGAATISLQTGANKVSVVVTSIDKSINKTYILNIYRGEIEASSAYLSDLKIKDATLSPNFDSMTNDYTTTVGLDVDKLDITTVLEDPSAEVLIKGNENLVEGENTITITVTSSDGENKQVYTIIVTKEEIEEEKDEEDKDIIVSKVEKKKNNTWLIILLSVLGVGLITVVFLLIFKNKKKKKNNKNDKNNSTGSKSSSHELLEDELLNESSIEKENTENLNILNETRQQLQKEEKQDIDEALDDLMKTKRLELGDLDF